MEEAFILDLLSIDTKDPPTTGETGGSYTSEISDVKSINLDDTENSA